MNIIQIDEAYCQDLNGNMRVVRKGDKIELLPADCKMRPEDDLTKAEAREKRMENFTFMRQWLGPGPYTIDWIGQWGCGGIDFYLKNSHGVKPGASSLNFRCI